MWYYLPPCWPQEKLADLQKQLTASEDARVRAEEECRILRERSGEVEGAAQQTQAELTSQVDELKLKVRAKRHPT